MDMLFLDNSNFFGDKISAQIMLTQNLPRHRHGIYTLETNVGHIDSVAENDIFKWEDRANILGVNTVTGKLRFKNRDIDITRPFSFSYFVAAPGVALQINKNNFCYLDMPNPIRIHIPGYPADKINLTVEAAKVVKIENGVFDIRFSKMPHKKVYAFVKATNAQGHTSTVHSIELKVIAPPPPISNLEAFKNDGLDVASFRNLKSISAVPADSSFGVAYLIESFEVEIIDQNNKYTEPIHCSGAEFENNSQLKVLIENAQRGDRYIFSNIKTRCSNGKNYWAMAVSLILK